MSKLSFRARALDANKQLQIYRSEDEPDVLLDTSSATAMRSIPQMPTGMEKEEEEEEHIQKAIADQAKSGGLSAMVSIPIPEVSQDVPHYEELTPPGYKPPKHYIRVQLFTLDDELPDYDMDSEDEDWLKTYNGSKSRANSRSSLSADTFERYVDSIEKANRVAPVREKDLADILSGCEEKLAKDILGYCKRRWKAQATDSITPYLKPDAGPDAVKDPYVAFRRRVERMQTRKNRKNDETGYVNMLKLRRDFDSVKLLVDMVRSREAEKLKLVETQMAIDAKRFSLEDWEGSLAPYERLSREEMYAKAAAAARRAATVSHEQKLPSIKIKLKAPQLNKHKRSRKRRRELEAGESRTTKRASGSKAALGGHADSSDESDELSDADSTSAHTDSDYEHDEPFRFRRRSKVVYHAPLHEVAMRSSREGMYFPARPPNSARLDWMSDPEHQGIPRPILSGHCRRRFGRGGRIFIDRCVRQWDWFNELVEFTGEQTDDTQQWQRQKQRQQEIKQNHELAKQQQLHRHHQQQQHRAMAHRAHQAGAAARAAAVGAGVPGFRPDPRLPAAGTNFGHGGENVAAGPMVKVLTSPTKGAWVPMSDAEREAARMKAHNSHAHPSLVAARAHNNPGPAHGASSSGGGGA